MKLTGSESRTYWPNNPQKVAGDGLLCEVDFGCAGRAEGSRCAAGGRRQDRDRGEIPVCSRNLPLSAGSLVGGSHLIPVSKEARQQ